MTPDPPADDGLLRDALGGLGHGSAGATPDAWAPASELRARGDRRHRRRVLGASGSAVVAVAVAVVLAVSIPTTASRAPSRQGGPRSTEPIPTTAGGVPVGAHVGARQGSAVELTALTTRVPARGDAGRAAEAEQAFGLSVLRRLVASSPGQDVVDSPASLFEDLLMVELGARGATARGIASALGDQGASVSQVADWAALMGNLSARAEADHVALEDADSVWSALGVPISPTYLETLRGAFGAGVWQADFARHQAEAVAAIDAWADHATGGEIPDLLSTGDVPTDTIFALLNAVYFKAQWAQQLVPDGTGPFHAPTGSTTASYLKNLGQGYLDASDGNAVDVVQLPYGNGLPGGSGHFAAVLAMPTSGSLATFTNGLDARRWRSLVDGLKPTATELDIPSFSLRSSLNLNNVLEGLGMGAAFSPSADFSGISPLADQLALVKQDAMLRVDQYGTVASAATASIGIATDAVYPQLVLRFDHPFVFAIRDTVTGEILFTAAVENPNG